VPDEVEPPIAVADSRYNIERVTDQTTDPLTGVVRWVWPRTGRVTSLVRRHREVANRRRCTNLRIPEVPRYAKTMQHEDKRRMVVAPGRHVEDHARRRRYAACLHHGIIVDGISDGKDIGPPDGQCTLH
jgi:hypothetical protein